MPSWRWVMAHLMRGWTYSMGSSMVMILKAAGLVQMVDHRRQGGALAAAGRTGYQQQAPGLHHQVLEDLRQFQFIDRWHLRRQQADGQVDAVHLPGDVATQAPAFLA